MACGCSISYEKLCLASHSGVHRLVDVWGKFFDLDVACRPLSARHRRDRTIETQESFESCQSSGSLQGKCITHIKEILTRFTQM